MSRFRAVATILVGLLFAPVASASSILEDIDAANKAFGKALMAGDIDYLVSEYTDDGCVVAPMAGEACGKDAIRAFWEAVIASRPQAVEIITEKAGSDGDLAFATGQLIVTDADSKVHKSRFALVLRKVGGAWKLRVDSWNPQ